MSDPSLFYLILAILLLPLMVSNETFWIDEGSTGLFARKPTFAAWWRYFDGNTSAETQMPLFLLLTHFWAKLVGSSERALRAINLIWGVLTLSAMAIAGRWLHLPWLPLFCVIQPYFWFYTSEARSYCLQIMLGSWLLVAFIGFLQTGGSDPRWVVLFTGISLVLFCTTILAPVALASIASVAAFFMFGTNGTLTVGSISVLACGALLALPLAAHYARTLIRGVTSAELWRVDAKYLGYVVYEVVGLTGLGPATAEIRGIAHSSHDFSGFLRRIRDFAGPILASIALAAIFLLGRNAFVGQFTRNPDAGAFLGVFLVGTLLFSIGSFAAQKAFWGRHYAPLFPFYVVGIALILAAMWRADSAWLHRSVAVVFLLLLFASSLSIRFSNRHRRDDYRRAAAHAKALLESGKTVWWIAAPEPAEYYGVPIVYEGPRQGAAFTPREHTGIPSTKALSHDLERLPVPDIIIVSKPDTYDVGGSAMACIERNNFRPVQTFKTFTVWEAPGAH